jgi:hypothetical protein
MSPPNRQGVVEIARELGILAITLYNQATGQQRQPLLGIAVPHLEVQAGPPPRPFQSVGEACSWVAAFASWDNDQHRHSGIRFVTPS